MPRTPASQRSGGLSVETTSAGGSPHAGTGRGGVRMFAASREDIADTSGRGAAAQQSGAAAQHPLEVAAGRVVASREEGARGLEGRAPPHVSRNSPTEHHTGISREQWLEIPLPYYLTAYGRAASMVGGLQM